MAFIVFSFGDEPQCPNCPNFTLCSAKRHNSEINHSLQVHFAGEKGDKFNIISVQISVAVG